MAALHQCSFEKVGGMIMDGEQPSSQTGCLRSPQPVYLQAPLAERPRKFIFSSRQRLNYLLINKRSYKILVVFNSKEGYCWIERRNFRYIEE